MPLQLADEWIDFEKPIGMRPRTSGKDVDEIRQNVERQQAGVPPLPPSNTLKIYDETLGAYKVRVYEPMINKGKVPLALFFHGGGYCLGDLDAEEETVRLMAENGPAVFVSVEYRLAPESRWPQSLNDCVAAAFWALNRFKPSSSVDTSKLVISGGSAGAQLALSTTIKLLESGQPVHAVVALAPLTIGPSAVPSSMKARYQSMTENADAPLLDTMVLKQFMDANGHEDSDPYFSILLNQNLNKLPKTYIATCGADCLRDDGFLLADELKSHSIVVQHDHYAGYPHYFWTLPFLKEKEKFQINLIKGLKFALS